MPQLQLPIFATGMNVINANLGYMCTGNSLTYFYGCLSVFTHDVDDQRSFRMITSQFYANGSATQAEICRAFGVSSISVKRSVKLYREKGIAGFFEEPRRRGAAVLTPEVLQDAQRLFDEGLEISEVATKQGVLADTLRKAIRSGKLHKPIKKKMRVSNS